jgi:hypothetical protein
MQRLKIALPDELRARLDAASKKSGQSVAEEIRSRVEASFTRETADQPTADFLEGLARMAAEIALECGGAWYAHAGSHETFAHAILSRLLRLKPEGSTTFGARPYATVSSDDPHDLGVLIEERLHQLPDFSSSPTRKLMESEHQKMKLALGFMAQGIARGRKFPQSLLSEPLDQPKKRGK